MCGWLLKFWRKKWKWVMICDCLLPVTILIAPEYNASDKNKIQESHATLWAEIRAGEERLVQPGPALPGSLGQLGVKPFPSTCQGGWLGFAHRSQFNFRVGTGRAEGPHATGQQGLVSIYVLDNIMLWWEISLFILNTFGSLFFSSFALLLSLSQLLVKRSDIHVYTICHFK